MCASYFSVLTSLVAQEKNEQQASEELMAAKEEELKAAQDYIDAQNQELASTDEAC